MTNKKLDEIVVADLDQEAVIQEPEAITQNRKDMGKKEKEDMNLTKKIKLHEDLEDSFDTKFLEDLGFTLDENNNQLMIKQTRYTFKLDFSKLPIIKLGFSADEDSPEAVLEFEDADECKAFINNVILGNEDKIKLEDPIESEDDAELEEDINADLDSIINKSIKPKKAMTEDIMATPADLMSDAYREADKIRGEAQKKVDEITTEAGEHAEAILDQARAEQEAEDARLNAQAEINLATSTLKNLIQDEWNTIEQYQSAISVISANTKDDRVLSILNDIVEEEMVHVGQLNKAMQYTIPEFERASNQGEEEAENQLEDDVTFDDIDAELEAELADLDSDVEDTSLDIEDEEPLPLDEPEELAELNKEVPKLPKENPSNLPDDDEPLPVDVDDDELE